MFPSIINTFNIVNPTDRLNSPSHSALHNSVSSVVTQIETFIGTNSSAVGTLMYDVRSPLSDGGGHIQSAVKGGTGQNTFIKGDLLVATGPSTISKLAVGSDAQALVADSSVAAGVKWGTPAGSKIQNIASVVTYTYNNGFSNASLVSVTVPGSTLGTSGAVRLTSHISNFQTAGGGSCSVLIRGTYGGAIVTSVMMRSLGNTPAGSMFGTINYTLIGNGASTQRGIMRVNLDTGAGNFNQLTSILGFSLYDMNVSSVETSANQSFGITAMGGDNDQLVMVVDGSIVEKIV